jgi:predicted anti-sigma-YlaC factor YlaD
MNCEQLKKELSHKLGMLSLTPAEKEHLGSCAGCMQFYKEMSSLEEGLKFEPSPLTREEFAHLQESLDNKISRFQNRAFLFYRVAVRYGASLAAVLLLVFVSMLGHNGQKLRPLSEGDSVAALISGTSAGIIADSAGVSSLAIENTEATDTNDETLDDQYLDVIIGNYVDAYGFNAGEMLLGELNIDELQILKSKMKAKDIL